MLELTLDNVYKVRNFAKHQNIKVKEKEISKNKEFEVKDNPTLSENLTPEILDTKDNKSEDKTSENRSSISEDVTGLNLDIINESKDNNIKRNSTLKDTQILFDTMESKSKTRKKKDTVIDIIVDLR